jgi:hypothetical protein
MNDTGKRPVWFPFTLHWLSLLGVALVATVLISWLFVLPQQIRGHADNPNVGIVVFLVLPAVFFTGLLLIPVGVYLSKHQIRGRLAEETFDRKTDLRRIAWFFGATTLHVAPGTACWLSSKTSGIRQLVETVLKTSPRPIPFALESNRLIPARETFENCHWPQRFGGVRLRVFSKYADDEANTRSETVLRMLVGGNRISGIHGAHFGPGVHVRFAVADANRQTTPWVEYRNTDTGDVRTFVSPETPPDSANALPKFGMECVDCHHRPTHIFELPERALDKALALGDIPVSLPYVKRKSLELLQANYATSAEAAAKLPTWLVTFYQQSHPDLYANRSQDIREAGRSVLAIYHRNVSQTCRFLGARISTTWVTWTFQDVSDVMTVRTRPGMPRPSPRMATVAMNRSQWMRPHRRS